MLKTDTEKIDTTSNKTIPVDYRLSRRFRQGYWPSKEHYFIKYKRPEKFNSLHPHAHGDAKDGLVGLEIIGDIDAEGRYSEFPQIHAESGAGAVEVVLAGGG